MLQNVQSSVGRCQKCGALVDRHVTKCRICQNQARNHRLVCVVEEYLDMIAIESSGVYQGVYHILGGAISPMNGVFIADLNFDSLFDRIAAQ